MIGWIKTFLRKFRRNPSYYEEGFYRDFTHKKLEEKFIGKTLERNPHLDWVISERLFMLNLVNEERANRNLSKKEEKDIERCEQRALGADYYRKFPLYCYELIEDENVP